MGAGMTKPAVEVGDVDLRKTAYTLTRADWTLRSGAVVEALLGCEATKALMEGFAKRAAHPMVSQHVQFVSEMIGVKRIADEAERTKTLKALHKRMQHNPFFYCTKTDIVVGKLNSTDWGPVWEECERAFKISCEFLGQQLLPRVLGSTAGPRVFDAAPDALKVTPGDFGDMIAKAAAGVVEAGACVAVLKPGPDGVTVDKTVGAAAVFGVENPANWEAISGPKTEAHRASALTKALEDSQPATVKFTASKNGADMSCLATLKPVAAKVGGYAVACFIDMSAQNVSTQIAAVETLIALVPSSLSCDDAHLVPAGADDDQAYAALGLAFPSDTPRDGRADAAGGGADGETTKPRKKGVNTATGENKDHFGKEFGKKHVDVGFDFETSKPEWFGNASAALALLLKTKAGVKQFGEFLDLEFRRPLLDFYLEVKSLESVSPEDRGAKAKEITVGYNTKLAQTKAAKEQAEQKGADTEQAISDACHVTKQDLTTDTATVWRRFYDAASAHDGAGASSGYDWYGEATKQAADMFDMLAVDAFTRFVLSKQTTAMHQEIRAELADKPDLLAEIDKAFRSTLLPKDVEEWVVALVAIIEKWPACIVVADMTISGAPMIYVNPQFCHCTKYAFDEAVGRNCRFLQGPETEDLSKDIIRRTLRDGRDCHVLITNYKKDATLFKNLLTMRPVFDADAVYRYCIGVQFEVDDPTSLTVELGRLDKLLQLLPCLVPFQGTLNESEHLPQSCLDAALSGPRKSLVTVRSTEEAQTAQRFAATKISWLRRPGAFVRNLVEDEAGAKVFQAHLSTRSPIAASAVDFCRKASELLKLADKLAPDKQKELADKLKKCARSNVIFTCSSADEAQEGDNDDDWWKSLLVSIAKWRDVWCEALATSATSPFLNAPACAELFLLLRQRETVKPEKGQKRQPLPKLHTILPRTRSFSHEALFLDLLHETSLSLGGDLGLVAADMRSPGLPLIYISGGFFGVTGFGKEHVGCPCTFLQGALTEEYVVDEIVDALRFASPDYFKITNYKANGDVFQCGFALVPVFGANSDDYIFQLGLQVDLTADLKPQAEINRLSALADVVRFIPKSVTSAPYPKIPDE